MDARSAMHTSNSLPPLGCSPVGVGRLSHVSLWGSCCLTGFTGISPEFCRNIELEHLKKGDNHKLSCPAPVGLLDVGRARSMARPPLLPVSAKKELPLHEPALQLSSRGRCLPNISYIARDTRMSLLANEGSKCRRATPHAVHAQRLLHPIDVRRKN